MPQSSPAQQSSPDRFSCSFGHLENTLTDTQPHRFPPLATEHSFEPDTEPESWSAAQDDDEFVFGFTSAPQRHAEPETPDDWHTGASLHEYDQAGYDHHRYETYDDAPASTRYAGRHDVDHRSHRPEGATGAYPSRGYAEAPHDEAPYNTAPYAESGYDDRYDAYSDDYRYDDEYDGYYYDDEEAGYAEGQGVGQPVTDGLNAVVDRFDQGMTFLDRLPNWWMAHYAPSVLRIGLGVIFLWFGALKFWPGLSPADALVRATFDQLLGVIGLASMSGVALYLLALFEVNIGLGLLFDAYRRALVWLLIGHMFGTLLPLVLLPGEIWTAFPHALTLEGQYIVKNLVLVGGAMAIGGARRSDDDDYDYDWDEHDRAEFWSERPLPTNGETF